MHNVEPADVLDTGDDLLEKPTCLLFFDSLYLHDIVKQLPTAGIFHDQIELLLRFNYFVELDDLRMPNYLENVNFAGHPLDISHIDYLTLLENLDGNLFICKNMRPQLNFPKGALSNGLPEDILSNSLLIIIRDGLGLFRVCILL